MNSNLLIFTLTFDNIILIKLFASLDFNPFYCMGQNVSVPINNKYMQLKNQISREKIYQFVIDSLKPYDLSGDTISRYLSAVRHLISFIKSKMYISRKYTRAHKSTYVYAKADTKLKRDALEKAHPNIGKSAADIHSRVRAPELKAFLAQGTLLLRNRENRVREAMKDGQ